MQLLPKLPNTALIAVLLLFAPFIQAGPPLDLAIIADRGATLGDCQWSLEHEPRLGASYIQFSKLHNRRAICTNDASLSCDSTIVGWKPTQCVARIDVYYVDGHSPPTSQVFPNNKGLCTYQAYSQDAGGMVNGHNRCFCSDVWLPDNC